MNPAIFVPILVVAVVIGAPVMLYGALVRLREMYKGAWGDVLQELDRRHEVIERLLCRLRDLNAEPAELARIEEIRRHSAVEGSRFALTVRENEITEALTVLISAVRRDTRLREDAPLRRGIQELLCAEDRLHTARQIYNGVVRDYNDRCVNLPSSCVARLAGLHPQEPLELQDARDRMAISLTTPPASA